MSNQEQMTIRAADLAERIVDEISHSDQDWGAIERQARNLLELLAGAQAPDGATTSARARAARTARLSVATS